MVAASRRLAAAHQGYRGRSPSVGVISTLSSSDQG